MQDIQRHFSSTCKSCSVVLAYICYIAACQHVKAFIVAQICYVHMSIPVYGNILLGLELVVCGTQL